MNLEELLQPLPGPAACGADLSFSPEFDRIQELRRFDDPTLSQGEWVSALKTAEWADAAAACEDLLRHKTKDLRVAGWLLEAWAHMRGYAGLADGLRLAHGLCERLWPELHPQPEGADFDLRTGALSRLLAQVAALSNALPVLRRDRIGYALRDMEAARALQSALAKAHDPSEVPTAGKATVDDIAKAQRETPPALVAECLAQAQQGLDALVALQALVDGHLGADGPGFSAARAAMQAAVHALQRLAKEMGADRAGPAVVADALASLAPSAADGGGEAGGFGGAPNTRAQAIAQLRQVAEFFRRTEPHSPVAYLADRAARWGEIPLHDWLRMVVKDGGTLGQLEELLGVPPKADGQ